jgi:hypothetical protein
MKIDHSQPKDSRSMQYLLVVFGIAFVARFLDRLNWWLHLAFSPLNFNHYPFTEWLINYQGGLNRRGLPGSVLLWLWQTFHIPPQLCIVILCFASYIALVVYVWKKSKDKFARWALLTTPLLGYPVYINGIMMRKDIFMVLVIAIAGELFIKKRFKGSDLIACVLLSFLVLSHELSFFMGFLIWIPVLLLREYFSLPLGASTFSRSSNWLMWVLAILRSILPRLVWLILPMATFAVILLQGKASISSASAIADSWRSAYDPTLAFPGAAGGIAWLASDTKDFVSMSTDTAKMIVFGVPYSLVIILSIVTGIFFIAAVFSRYSRTRSWFFVGCALIQFIIMLPLFYVACDHGRWVVLSLMMAFLLAIQVPLDWQEQLVKYSGLSEKIMNLSVPDWVAPLGLAFWGLSVVIWCPLGAPIGIFAQIYFYLRVSGFIPKIAI